MCGACGAGSARSATQHWSVPFLASIPARAAVGRTLTRWSRGSAWSGTVSGVAGGFEVATSSGRRALAPDLGTTLELLDAYGVDADRLLARSATGVVEGPPTRPGRRPRAHGAATGVAARAPVPETSGAGGDCRALPPDPRRRYRVPGLLAWLAAAEQTVSLGRLRVQLDLGGPEGILLISGAKGAITCDATPAPTRDVVAGLDGAVPAELLALLCPVVA